MKKYKLTAECYPDYCTVDTDRLYTITLTDDALELIKKGRVFLTEAGDNIYQKNMLWAVVVYVGLPEDFNVPENEDFAPGYATLYITELDMYYRLYNKYDNNLMIEFSMEEL